MPQPRRLVGEQAERGGVRLGKAELGERDHLGEHALGGCFGDPARRGAVLELLPESRHQLATAPPAHGPPQRFRLAGGESGERLAYLQYLVLIEYYAECFCQRVLEQGMLQRRLVRATRRPGAALVRT